MKTMNRRGMLKLLGTTPLISVLGPSSGLLMLGGQEKCPDTSLRLVISGTLGVVIWNHFIELLLPHHKHLTYTVYTTDPNNPNKILASEDLHPNEIYQLQGVDGSKVPTYFSEDSHVVLKSQKINRGGQLHCSIFLPLPDCIEPFCEVPRKDDTPFFTKAPTGVNPKSLFTRHRFVYKSFSASKAGLSTISPVGNALNISAEPTNPGDTGPFHSNTKLVKGLALELNNIYVGAGCRKDEQIMTGHPEHELPACMKLVVDNRVP
jgi:hypothetical protein